MHIRIMHNGLRQVFSVFFFFHCRFAIQNILNYMYNAYLIERRTLIFVIEQ